MSLICDECRGLIPQKRELAIKAFNLENRCQPCQALMEKQKPLQLRPENVKGIAVGGDFDETDTHFRERQGIL